MADYTSCETTAPPDETQTSTAEKQEHFLIAGTANNMVWEQVLSQFNSKWMYLLNVVLFEVGSAICGSAPNMNAMIIGRLICCIGGAGSATTTIAERPLYISGTGITWGLGTVLGPVVRGAFEQSAVGWRWAFYINLFIRAVCAPAYIFLLPSVDPRPGVSLRERASQLDYAGMVLLLGSLASFIMAINFGGLTYPASAAGAFIPIFFAPLFFQFIRNDGALDAGVRLLPMIIVLVVAVFVKGLLMAKFGYYMPWYLVSSLISVVGGASMYTVDRSSSQSAIYGYTVLIGFGIGIFIQASFSVAQAVVDPKNVASAVGFMTLAQCLGNTTALAIANSLFLNLAETKVQNILPERSASEIEAAISWAAGGFVQRLDDGVKGRVIDAIVDFISKTYILVMAAGPLVGQLSLFLKREKLFINPSVAAV
ncbi:Efflux pump DEP3 [Colletotrichum siamense]|uniref:Efflux pump DEP3 n=1 Tax=Colletotrichum siamense TaxID=690259 RepID=UPI001872A41E|nr:Efflux pump DEP3 [Colletotrichum siamense]KAF5485349.1 Efflux pump DEP3 [Colletotrichum siamense]